MNAAWGAWTVILADADARSAVQVNSIWDFCVKGGPVMVPLGVCSLVALAVIIERLLSLRRARIIPAEFVARLESALRGPASGGEGLAARALRICADDGSPVSNVFAAGLRRLGQSRELLERHVQEAGEREVAKLRKHLRVLQVLASVAPLLGLLGTILGMITAFQTVAASGEALGKTELLAKGIYEAMITTAAGLMVAIPVVVCYHLIAGKIDRLVAEIDEMTVHFFEEHAIPAAGPDGVARAPVVSAGDGQTSRGVPAVVGA